MPEFQYNGRTDLPAPAETIWLLDHTGIPIGATELREFFRGYVTAMLWANLTWGTESGNEPEGFSETDVELSPSDLVSLADDALSFVSSAAEDLLGYVDMIDIDPQYGTAWDYAGHDFALTRNHHGAGFWNRGLGDLGERLTAWAHTYGEAHIWASVTDGKLEVGVE